MVQFAFLFLFVTNNQSCDFFALNLLLNHIFSTQVTKIHFVSFVLQGVLKFIESLTSPLNKRL